MEAADGDAVCEFFAGMGLVRRAVEGATTWPARNVVWANDFDPVKGRLYRASFGPASEHVFDPRDIHDVQPDDVPRADLWTASFPCTDLSLAGRGRGIHAGQSAAVWRLLELLEAKKPGERPTHILFENVPALLSSHGGADFAALVQSVHGAGYGVDPMLVDAACFTSQSRLRVILLATKLGSSCEPARVDPSRLAPTLMRPARLLAAMRCSGDAVWHARDVKAPTISAKPALVDILEDICDDSPVWWDAARTERFVQQAHPAHRDRLTALRSGAHAGVATAFRRMRVIEGVKRPVWELRVDGLAGCLRTPKGGSAVQALVDARSGAIRVRKLSPIECARLQGVETLPEGFSDTDLLFALGDAVCVPAIRWALELLAPDAAAVAL